MKLILDGIRKMLQDWQHSGGEWVVEVDGDELSISLASPPKEHLFEVFSCREEKSYKVKIQVELEG